MGLLVGCTTTTTPVVTTVPEEVIEEPEAVVHALEEEQPIEPIEPPEVLVERARLAPQSEAVGLLFLAISGFIDAGQLATAEIIVNELSVYPLDSRQKLTLQLQRAKLSFSRGYYDETLAQLRFMEPGFGAAQIDLADPDSMLLYTDFLSVRALSHIGLNRLVEALGILLDLDNRLLPENRGDNQKLIVQIIRRIDPMRRPGIADTTGTLQGWLQLVDMMDNADPLQRDFALGQWQSAYPFHPAGPEVLQQLLSAEQEQVYRQIAVLLPLTSPFGSAAQAFYDGFLAARENDRSPRIPDVRLHDIGNDPGLSTFYYRGAVNEGADFVVGPLGRKAVNEWLGSQIVEVPTLVISDVSEEAIDDQLFGISLSPEKEATAMAQKAFSDGHRNALVFRIDSSWGQRVADAFSREWEALGGTITKNSSFPKEISDFSRIIKKLLKLDKSIARHELLNAQLGRSFHFSPTRRDDMDFLFLASNPNHARLVVPQLRFFQAHNLPIYSISNIYGAEPDPSLDTDLEGLVLGEMPWLVASAEQFRANRDQSRAALAKARAEEAAAEEAVQQTISDGEGGSESAELTTEAPTEAPEKPDEPAFVPRIMPPSPYANTPLDRLYALGYTSYEAIPMLNFLRNNSLMRHRGTAVDFSVDQDGNVVRHLEWVQFRDGLIQIENQGE